jgi:hypothetical protein
MGCNNYCTTVTYFVLFDFVRDHTVQHKTCHVQFYDTSRATLFYSYALSIYTTRLTRAKIKVKKTLQLQ